MHDTHDALQRKLDMTIAVYDAGKQALETGAAKGLSALLKGEEASFKETMKKICFC